MSSDSIVDTRGVVNLFCKLLKLFAIAFCVLMVFSLVNTDAYYSWSNVIAVIFSIFTIVSAIYLGHTLKKRWMHW